MTMTLAAPQAETQLCQTPSDRARAFAERWAFPVVFAAALLAVYALSRTSLPIWAATGLPVLVAGIVVALLEWRFPHERQPKITRSMVTADAVTTGITALIPSAFEALTLGALVLWSSQLTEAVGSRLWPQAAPLALQLALALVISEFGQYWFHRLCHRSELFWRVHAMHHSSDPLYILASGRNHPINAFIMTCLGSGPLVLLGAPAEVFMLYGAFKGVLGFFQHANFLTRSGILNWAIATPELHRYHHSRDMFEGNMNFGNNLIVWDRLFGTYWLPKDKPAPASVGIDGMDFGGLFSQLASPFRWKPLFKPAQPSET